MASQLTRLTGPTAATQMTLYTEPDQVTEIESCSMTPVIDEDYEMKMQALQSVFKLCIRDDIAGRTIKAWTNAGPLDMYTKITEGVVQPNLNLPIVQKHLTDNITYLGQDPTIAKSFIGRLETEYGIKEGVFTQAPDEIGGMILHGYGRITFPEYQLKGRFVMGVRQVEEIPDVDIPDSRQTQKSLFKFIEDKIASLNDVQALYLHKKRPDLDKIQLHQQELRHKRLMEMSKIDRELAL